MKAFGVLHRELRISSRNQGLFWGWFLRDVVLPVVSYPQAGSRSARWSKRLWRYCVMRRFLSTVQHEYRGALVECKVLTIYADEPARRAASEVTAADRSNVTRFLNRQRPEPTHKGHMSLRLASVRSQAWSSRSGNQVGCPYLGHRRRSARNGNQHR